MALKLKLDTFTLVMAEVYISIRTKNNGKKVKRRNAITQLVNFRAFFSLENFFLASRETCWAAMHFTCRRVSEYTPTWQKIITAKITLNEMLVKVMKTLMLNACRTAPTIAAIQARAD